MTSAHGANNNVRRSLPEFETKFLETTKAQLDAHYAKVGALLNRRYFTH